MLRRMRQAIGWTIWLIGMTATSVVVMHSTMRRSRPRWTWQTNAALLSAQLIVSVSLFVRDLTPHPAVVLLAVVSVVAHAVLTLLMRDHEHERREGEQWIAEQLDES
jgi:CHASE2 domain-containing sensor protein